MTKRYRKFQEKRRKKRRHILLSVSLTFLLALSFLVVDLNSSQMLTGQGAVRLLSVQNEEDGKKLYLFGMEFSLPF